MSIRKHRSKAEWNQLIEQHARSGLNGSAFCRQQGLSRKSFYRHRKALQQVTRAAADPGLFVRLVPFSGNRSGPTGGPIELAHRESRLRLPADTDPMWLAQLIKALS